MAELWDVLDGEGNKTGRVIERGEKLRSDEYMMAVHVYLCNLQGEFLVQKRSMNKPILPGVWDVTGGAIVSGEEGYEAAIREVEEEVGIRLRKENLFHILTVRRERYFADIWFAIADFRLCDCILQEDEVDEVKFVSAHDMKQLLTEAVYRKEDYKRMVMDAIEWIEYNIGNLTGNIIDKEDDNMCNNIIYDHDLNVTDYNNLRNLVGWGMIPEKQAQAGLNNSDYVIVAKVGDRTVGMSRVLTDGGCVALILDVVVHPDYQGKGIGRTLMQSVMNFINNRIEQGEVSHICLMAAKGKEEFYKKFGFEERPNDNRGAGMTQWIKKEA
jgi:8-oxo-dGTP pyrophosphatase MutT (NUDIX family)/GNAT superfamily N-acetyltransferase